MSISYDTDADGDWYDDGDGDDYQDICPDCDGTGEGCWDPIQCCDHCHTCNGSGAVWESAP